jgi:hypothetical protein
MKNMNETKGIFLRMPLSLLKKIEEKAEKEDRTRQNWILKVLKEKVR